MSVVICERLECRGRGIRRAAAWRVRTQWAGSSQVKVEDLCDEHFYRSREHASKGYAEFQDADRIGGVTR